MSKKSCLFHIVSIPWNLEKTSWTYSTYFLAKYYFTGGMVARKKRQQSKKWEEKATTASLTEYNAPFWVKAQKTVFKLYIIIKWK